MVEPAANPRTPEPTDMSGTTRLVVSSHITYAIEVPNEYIKGHTGQEPADITDEHLSMMGNETDGLGWALWEAAKALPGYMSDDAYIELARPAEHDGRYGWCEISP